MSARRRSARSQRPLEMKQDEEMHETCSDGNEMTGMNVGGRARTSRGKKGENSKGKKRTSAEGDHHDRNISESKPKRKRLKPKKKKLMKLRDDNMHDMDNVDQARARQAEASGHDARQNIGTNQRNGGPSSGKECADMIESMESDGMDGHAKSTSSEDSNDNHGRRNNKVIRVSCPGVTKSESKPSLKLRKSVSDMSNAMNAEPEDVKVRSSKDIENVITLDSSSDEFDEVEEGPAPILNNLDVSKIGYDSSTSNNSVPFPSTLPSGRKVVQDEEPIEPLKPATKLHQMKQSYESSLSEEELSLQNSVKPDLSQFSYPRSPKKARKVTNNVTETSTSNNLNLPSTSQMNASPKDDILSMLRAFEGTSASGSSENKKVTRPRNKKHYSKKDEDIESGDSDWEEVETEASCSSAMSPKRAVPKAVQITLQTSGALLKTDKKWLLRVVCKAQAGLY